MDSQREAQFFHLISGVECLPPPFSPPLTHLIGNLTPPCWPLGCFIFTHIFRYPIELCTFLRERTTCCTHPSCRVSLSRRQRRETWIKMLTHYIIYRYRSHLEVNPKISPNFLLLKSNYGLFKSVSLSFKNLFVLVGKFISGFVCLFLYVICL